MSRCNYDEGGATQFVVNNAVVINVELNFKVQPLLLTRNFV